MCVYNYVASYIVFLYFIDKLCVGTYILLSTAIFSCRTVPLNDVTIAYNEPTTLSL